MSISFSLESKIQRIKRQPTPLLRASQDCLRGSEAKSDSAMRLSTSLRDIDVLVDTQGGTDLHNREMEEDCCVAGSVIL